MLGALVFLSAAVFICSRFVAGGFLRLLVFIALVGSPFTLDHLVAARGYSMAIGFLLAEVAALSAAIVPGAKRVSMIPVALGSFCAGLSFSANFSFAFVAAATLLAFLAWALVECPATSRLRLLAVAVAPGLVLALAICGWTLAHWPPNQFIWGAQSLNEFLAGLRDYSFDRRNPVASNPLMVRIPRFVSTTLIAVGSVAALALIVPSFRVRQRSGFALFTFGSLALALAFHLAAYGVFYLLLPLGRTALFIPVLATLSLGCALGFTQTSKALKVARVLGFLAIGCSDAYFLGCLRYSFFREWVWNADSRETYRVVSDLHQRCGVSDFAVEWRYTGVLNFYRRMYNDNTLKEFERGDPFVPGHRAYVLYFPGEGAFVRDAHLRIVYRNETYGTAVAVQQDVCPAA